MHQTRFDTLTRTFGRRAVSRGIAGAAIVAALAPGHPGVLSARKSKKKKQKPKVNRFGCRNVGAACASSNQCCSGICEGRGGKTRSGKRRKKTCRAHDTGGCRLEDDSCLVEPVPCVTSEGQDGFCQVTTGNAPYCAVSGVTFGCTRDVECVQFCGERAACGVCADPDLGTFQICAGLGECSDPPEG